MMLIEGKPFAQTAVAISGIDEFESEVNDPPIKIAWFIGEVQRFNFQGPQLAPITGAITWPRPSIHASSNRATSKRRKTGNPCGIASKCVADGSETQQIVIRAGLSKRMSIRANSIARRRPHEANMDFRSIVVLEAGLLAQNFKGVHAGATGFSGGFRQPFVLFHGNFSQIDLGRMRG